MRSVMIGAATLLLVACGGNGGGSDGPDADAGVVDAADPGAADAADPGPSGPDADVAPDRPDAPGGDDVPPTPPDPPFVPGDERLRASFATRDFPVPLGVSTAGYGQLPPPGAPKSPFAAGFQATTTLLHPPRVQVLHVLKGDRRLLLVASDLIAILRTVHVRVVEQVRERTGVDVSDVLILAGNHSHTAPARLFDTPLGPFFADSYEDAIFQRVVGALVDAIVDAMSREAVPVRSGNASLLNDEAHVDRRCENGPVRDDTLHVLRLDRADGSGTLAVLISYALHGTVFGWEAGMLGGDAPRSVELKVQEALPGGPPVLFFQSWTGDVGPANPVDRFPASPYPAAPLEALDQLEAIGRSVAETILADWDGFDWQDDPELVTASAVAPMNWESIYAPGEWDHPAGTILCGENGSVCGDKPPKMDVCIDLDYGWLPETARLTAFRLGVLAGVTLPGEPHTALGLELLDRVRQHVRPAWHVILLGYAQDYFGYLMKPDDYAGGGYEPSMAFLGPRQGEYLRDAAASVAARLSNPDAPLAFVPQPLPAWAPGASVPYTPAASVDPGAVLQDLPATATAGDVLTFRWAGGDPWVDRPEVVVERDDGGAFVPVDAGGRPLDQRDYRVLLSVLPDPAWGQPAPGGRRFAWTATLRTAVRVPAALQALEGTVRVRAAGRAVSATGAEAAYEIVSTPTAITPLAAP